MIDGELGSFIRARREAVRPEDVGLPPGLRRRTPGLRRSELATLAGISVEYLTRLEQGRDARPSTQVVAAIADALRLGDDDRLHLHQLVALSQGRELVCGAGSPCAAEPELEPTLAALLDRLEPAPAYVVGRHGELLAWTDAFHALAAPTGMLDGESPNIVRWTFADDRARRIVRDWDGFADEQVAWLHQNRGGGPSADELAAALSERPGFAQRWAPKPLGSGRPGTRDLIHPEEGLIGLRAQTLAAADGVWLVVLLPADAAAEAALDRLAGRRPGALRQVSS